MGYADRALKTLSAGNRALLRAERESELLGEMCRVIGEQGGYRMAYVAYAEHDEQKSLRPVAHFGVETGYLSFHLSWAGDQSSPVAQVIQKGKPVVMQSASEAASYRLQIPIEEALERGYASAAIFPLMIDGHCEGLLAIYAAEPDAFDEAECKLLGELADDLAFGISTLRMRARHLEAEETIRRMAYVDGLTGLPNRASLIDRLEKAIDIERHERQSLALLLLKVERFQEIGETLGYAEGDALIGELGGRLRHIAADNATVARVGEDEFAVILPQLSAEAASRAARRFMQEICGPAFVGGLMVDPNVSAGIALFPGHGRAADVLLRRAKVAAAQGKATVGRCAIYRGSRDEESKRRLVLMSDLRTAIEGNQLHLFCQPKVTIRSREVCGAEALVRWEHPLHGIISTGEFVALAEHAGLIMPLTRWVLEAAFRQSFTWQDEGIGRSLSVNLSVQDLRDPTLVERIGGLLETWAVPPDSMHFELTESALMEDPAGALDTLTRLKDMGVSLHIDDFGTGYSSLSYLQRLPVDALKIDQSFVRGMLADSGSAIIVRSTIELGHNLGLEVIAEGVESEAHWDALSSLGCDKAQGYFVGRPIPSEQFSDWEAHSRWHGEPLGGG